METIKNMLGYMLYKNDTNTIIGDQILPKILTKVIDVSTDTVISKDTLKRCTTNIQALDNLLVKNGFNNTNSQIVLKYYPIYASNNLELLGEYIANTLLCKYLEKNNNPNELVIKLNQESQYSELNDMVKILKKGFKFENSILVYDYDSVRNINFIKLKYIINDQKIITINDVNWLHNIQSAYTELFQVVNILHTFWHLIDAHIMAIAKQSINDINLREVFTMSENNVYLDATLVKTIFYESPLLFNQILYNDPEFIIFSEMYINTYIDNFDINNIIQNDILHELNSTQLWVPGMTSNCKLIKNLTANIMNKTSKNLDIIKAWNWNLYSNQNTKITFNASTEKYLQILYVIGSVYHSNSFEYAKMSFTDIIYNNDLNKNYYNIGISTLDWKYDDILFGDISIYNGKYYLNEFELFKKNVELNRQQITKDIEHNMIFKLYTYSDVDLLKLHFSINTWVTSV